jgi:hypothetical protein
VPRAIINKRFRLDRRQRHFQGSHFVVGIKGSSAGLRSNLKAINRSLKVLAHPDPMAESRRAPRYRVAKTGTIRFRGVAIDCLVRNLSTTGAALEVSGQASIPQRFILAVPGDGLHLACRVAWRKEYRIGVAFG